MKASVLIARLKALKALNGDFDCSTEVDGAHWFIDDVQQKEVLIMDDEKIHIVFDLTPYVVPSGVA